MTRFTPRVEHLDGDVFDTLGFGSRFFVSLRTVLLFAAMGLPPLPPLKMATDPPRFFADRLFGIPSWHAAVLLSTTHAREPNPKTTPTEP